MHLTPVTATLLSTTSSASNLEKTSDISAGDVVGHVGTVAEMIDKYGPLIVCLAVVLVLFIIFMLYMIHRTNKTINTLMKSREENEKQDDERLNKLLDYIMSNPSVSANLANQITQKMESNLHEHEKAHEKKDLVGMYIDVNMAFKNASRVAINKLHCERIGIYVFHNGNKSMHGLPFFKMSCVHEWTIKGSKTIRGKMHSELPLHMYSDIVEGLATDGEYVVSDIQKQALMVENLIQFTTPSDVKSFFMLGMKDNDGILAGFTIAEYNQQVDFANLETYTKTKNTLNDLNETIKGIIIDQSFIKGLEK